MKRKLLAHLQSWLNSTNRKPLVIRGARQVGKTWLVRHLAAVSGKQLIELNFEKNSTLASLFDVNDPQRILLNLSSVLNQSITPETSILFLDEIQAVPELLAKLRWFAEEMSQLAVIAAGSLLEFVLADHSFSMPVGRISYLHLEPLSFEEFLLANAKDGLVDYLSGYELNSKIPQTIHESLRELFKEYVLIGGMPAAIVAWITEHDWRSVQQIQMDLLATYRDDFAKFKGRLAIERLVEVMHAIPTMLGQKFMFNRVNADVSASTVKNVLDLLSKARVCHPVWSSAANGIPMAAEKATKYFKEIFLDTGLCCAELGLNLTDMRKVSELVLINSGGIAEQVVGQLLRTLNPPYMEPELYYWRRDEKGASAEIDYLVQHGNKVIPLEVKAGSTGGLKSLHLFMHLKKLKLAVRINADYPSLTDIHIKNGGPEAVQYQLLSLPFYLLEQLPRLLARGC